MYNLLVLSSHRTLLPLPRGQGTQGRVPKGTVTAVVSGWSGVIFLDYLGFDTSGESSIVELPWLVLDGELPAEGQFPMIFTTTVRVSFH